MLRKTTTLFVSLLILIFLACPAVADDHESENEGVAVVVKITPKDGHEDELLDAIEKYHKAVAKFEGAMRYKWYEAVTGPDTGKFFARSGDHNWAEFDAEYDWQEEAGEMFEELVAPHVESAERMMTTEMDGMAHWPDSMEGYTHFAVQHWYIKNGMYGKFNQSLKKNRGHAQSQ